MFIVTELVSLMSRDMRFQQCGMCDKQILKAACAYTQSDQSFC